jgi:hypothetical protein
VDGNKIWVSITSNSTGDKLAAVVSGGSIYGSSFSSEDNAGTITRIFNEGVNGIIDTVRNFLTEGGRNNWIVIAQGVTVRLWNGVTGAIYNVASNIFKALAGGSFIANPDMNGGAGVVPEITIASTTISYVYGDDSTKILRWAPSINWGTSSVSCIYSYNEDFSSSTIATCSTNDTSLPRPFGANANIARTLYLRATNSNGGIAEKSITYFYDNTTPISTTCGNNVLDEDRTYFLESDTTSNCTVTASATLQGASSTTARPYRLNGAILVNGTGLTLTLKNMYVSSSTLAYGSNLVIEKSFTGLLVTDGVSTSTTNANGGNAGSVTVSTSSIATGISTNGGSGGANGGDAGSVYTLASAGRIAGANITTVISANGGNSTYCGYGGKEGTISLIRSNFSTSTYSAGISMRETSANGGHCPSTLTGTGGTSGSSHSEGTFTAGSDFPDQSVIPGTDTNTTNTNTTNNSNSGTRTFTPGTINQITLPVQQLKPIKFTPLPTFGTDTKGSFSFLTPIQNFLFAPMPKVYTDMFKSVPKLEEYLKTLGLVSAQSLLNIQKKPITLLDNSKKIEGIWSAYTKGIPRKNINGEFTTTNLSITSKLAGNKTNIVYQTLKVSPGTSFTIALTSSATTNTVTAKFNGKDISLVREGKVGKFTANITAPKKAGTYTITTNATPLPLKIEVVSNQTNTVVNNGNTDGVVKTLWGKVKGFFRW